MIGAIISLSVCVLILLVALLRVLFNCSNLESMNELLNSMLSEKEELYCRAQKLVMDKFGYYVPNSKLYLEIAEHELRKEQGSE